MGRLKQYKGIELINRDGSRPVCTERFTTRNNYNTRLVDEIQYKIKGLEHRYNYWQDAASIKYKIDLAFAGEQMYDFILQYFINKNN